MKGLGLLVYGSEGIGKTSFALRFPQPLICLSCGETGYEDLELIQDVPPGCENINIKNYSQIDAILQEIESGTIVIDSCSGMQALLFSYVCSVEYGGDWDKFMAFYRGPRKDSPPVLQNTLDLCNRARNKGVHIVFLGHTATDAEPNAFGADYLSHILRMDASKDAGIRHTMTEFAQAILFMTLDITIDRATTTDKLTKLILEGKATTADRRIMYTTKSTSHSAKNRLNLPPVILLGDSADEAFNNFWSKLPPYYNKPVPTNPI